MTMRDPVAMHEPLREPVIGLEIHVQLDTRTKLFCGDAVAHHAPPNTHVCPVCLGLPGALPVVNAHAVELAVRAATMLGCSIRRSSRFVRKNYFYPDLPKGYQITQLEDPLATGGAITLTGSGGSGGSGAVVRISRVHIEEDAGKLLHDRIPDRTAIDLNRCGIPLLEIVTEPELRSAADAVALARQLKQLLQYARVSDCDMELGSLRVDANVSLDSADAAGDPAGVRAGRTEIKNINSFSQLERAIDAEISRQRVAVGNGDAIANETLIWDADAGALRVLRSKEQRAEYRYFADPDLPPLMLSEALLERALRDMPELPADRQQRYAALGLPAATTAALAADRAIAAYFDATLAAGAAAPTAAAWVLTHVLAWCNAHHTGIDAYPVSAARLADAIARTDAGTLSRDGARLVIARLERDGDADVSALIESLGVAMRHDGAHMAGLISEVLVEQRAVAAQFRAGDSRVFGYLMGCVMAKTGRNVDPRAVSDMLRAHLIMPHLSDDLSG